MSDECNATGYVVPFGAFTSFTPVVPEVFWNVYSSEQRYKYLCEWLQALTDYVETVVVEVNDLAEKVDALSNKYNREIPALNARVKALEDIIETITTSTLVYDPTKGAYTASIDQSRRMLQILATPADDYLTVQQLVDSGVSVNQLSTVMCGELINESFKRMKNKIMPEQEVF